MDQSVLVTSQELTIEKGHSINSPSAMSLRQCVRAFLKQHLMQFETSFSDFYNLIWEEVEAPMLEFVLQHTGQNQSKAARILSMSRGTLRKKMQHYRLLPQSARMRRVKSEVI